jgi:isopenicillin-N epimerase
MNSRRDFLTQLTIAGTGLYAIPSSASQPTAAKPAMSAATLAPLSGESLWRFVKDQFSIKPGLVLLNAANLCPSPRVVQERIAQLGEDLESDVSFQNRAKFEPLREEARAKLAAFLGATPDEISLVRNTSEANALIINGLPLGPGDEVIVYDQNHPTNNVAWDVRAARIGFTVKRVSVETPATSSERMIEAFRAAISSKTKVMTFTDVSNTTGTHLPVAQLCALGRSNGIHVHVDGAQTFGSLALNLRKIGCDSYAASGHKWFMGPKETGVLFVREDRIRSIWPSTVGLGWGDQVATAARGARKFETLGQRDDAAIAALATTVDFHNLLGPARIEARIRELATALKQGMARIPGAIMPTSMQPELSAGVCIAKFDGADHRRIHQSLYSQYGIAGAAAGGIRLCPHIYNSAEDIERALTALDRSLRSNA